MLTTARIEVTNLGNRPCKLHKKDVIGWLVKTGGNPVTEVIPWSTATVSSISSSSDSLEASAEEQLASLLAEPYPVPASDAEIEAKLKEKLHHVHPDYFAVLFRVLCKHLNVFKESYTPAHVPSCHNPSERECVDSQLSLPFGQAATTYLA